MEKLVKTCITSERQHGTSFALLAQLIYTLIQIRMDSRGETVQDILEIAQGIAADEIKTAGETPEKASMFKVFAGMVERLYQAERALTNERLKKPGGALSDLPG